MKKRISILLIITILIINVSTVNIYASGYQPSDGGYWDSLWGTFENGALKGYQEILRTLGFIVDTQVAIGRSNIQFIKDRLIALGILDNNATDQDVEDFFNDNITENSDNVTLSNNLNVYLKSEVQDIINNSGYKYVNGYFLGDAVQGFSTAIEYNACSRFLNNNANNYINLFLKTSNKHYIITTSNNNISFVLRSSLSREYSVYLYDAINWERVRTNDLSYFTWFEYDATQGEFISSSDSYSDNYVFVQKENYKNVSFMDTGLSYEYTPISSKGNNIYKMYMSYEDLKASSVGLSPYYISNKWNTYSNDNNSTYTVDSSNSNNVSYGDVTNYINSFNSENGKYPNPTDINVYIDNNIPQPNPTPTPNPDNPGGSGSDDDSGSIFDWLSKIGTLIGNLISGVGGFIAGVLEGVINALTSILDTITSIITTITTSIPDNFNNLMTTILGWLPEEWTAVISAFLLVSLLVGLFKLFRG